MKSVMLARDDFDIELTDHFDNLIEQLFPGMSEEKREEIDIIDLRVSYAAYDYGNIKEV